MVQLTISPKAEQRPEEDGKQFLDIFPCILSNKNLILSLIARFMGPTWGPSGADRTQVGPMLVPGILLSGMIQISRKIVSMGAIANELALAKVMATY